MKSFTQLPRSLAMILFGLALLGTAGEVEVWDGYPPVPQPVRGTTELGVYIFPGWYRDTGRGDYPYRTHDEDSEWRAIAKKPKPRALLGFYDDSLPEVNDWHILWAVEHGITWFAFDWYCNAGEHRLLRTLSGLVHKHDHVGGSVGGGNVFPGPRRQSQAGLVRGPGDAGPRRRPVPKRPGSSLPPDPASGKRPDRRYARPPAGRPRHPGPPRPT